MALPVALVLGAAADLAGGLISRFTGGSRWRPLFGLWDETRRLVRARTGRARPTISEVLGGLAAIMGGGLAAAGALGLVPGSAALVYLSLALGAAGLQLGRPFRAGGTGSNADGMPRALAEAAFVVALGVLLFRWRMFDLDAIRATQTVLGPAVSVAPVRDALGIGIAAAAALAAGALRQGAGPEPADRRGGQTRGAGGRLIGTLARWAVTGSTAIVIAALAAGHRLDLSADVIPFAGGAVGFTILLGATGALFRRAGRAGRTIAAAVAIVLAAGAAALVVTA